MNFKQATDALLEAVTLQDLASAMGVSLQSLRQARTAENSTAYRAPPENWQVAVARLAKRAASRHKRLEKELGAARKHK